MDEVRIFQLGDRAATIEFGAAISFELNEKVLSAARFFAENPFCGLIECVPAYASLTLFYDVAEVRKNNPRFPTAFAAVESFARKALSEAEAISASNARFVKIPVCFDRRFAPDLADVATEKRLTIEDVVRIFTGRSYHVFMLGFLPGFAYMGETDERIAIGRRAAPRLSVEAGSVGLAGRQTGIYSLASPGGWQIIGRTPLKLFNPDAEKIALLAAGDRVEFYPITRADFERLAGED